MHPFGFSHKSALSIEWKGRKELDKYKLEKMEIIAANVLY